MLIKAEDYKFDKKVKLKCNDYFECALPGNVLCVLADNKKWSARESQEWEAESKYLRTSLFKQHGFFAEQYHSEDPMLEFPIEPEKELLYGQD